MIEDSDYRIYTAICRGLDHEAKVMGDRIQWAISFTGGLFAASALLITMIVIGRPPAVAVGFLLLVMGGIAAVGVVFSWTTRGGVKAAQGQFEELCGWYKEREARFRALELPRPFGDRKDHTSGNFAARVFPVVMLVCWTIDLLLSWSVGFLILGTAGSAEILAFWPALNPPA